MDNEACKQRILQVVVATRGAYKGRLLAPVQKKNIMRGLLRLYELYREIDGQKSARSMWVREIFSEEQRMLQGASDNLVVKMRLRDHAMFFNFFRMTPDVFDSLLNIVGPHIEKLNTVRNSIAAKTRLEITLRYLATGDSMKTIAYMFLVSPSSVSKMVHQVSQEIWKRLKGVVLKMPSTEEWLAIAEKFQLKTDFPNVASALDGKHCFHQAPKNSGSKFYNYKNCHSINLTAMCDADYRFTVVDVGAEGRASDGGVFDRSRIKARLEEGQFNMPGESVVGTRKLPHVILGDEAYPLRPYLLRPYPRRKKLTLKELVFNYRLSRARRFIECAFGIMAARWRILRRPLNTDVDKSEKLILAIICLHNFVITKELEKPSRKRRYVMAYTDDEIDDLVDIEESTDEELSPSGAEVRDAFAEYLMNEGAVDYQWQMARQYRF